MLAEIMSIIFVDLDTLLKLNFVEVPSPECEMIKTDLLWWGEGTEPGEAQNPVAGCLSS